MGGVDIDGDKLVTLMDLFLVITCWFAFSVSLLLCYLCFDTFDRMRRNRDIELNDQNDYERVDNEDSETAGDENSDTDESILSEEPRVTIDNFEGVYFHNGLDLA